MPSGEWRMRGAITQGDLSSWTVTGSFARETTAAHAYQAGFSYGMQRYAGGNAEALAAMRDGSRTVGMLYAYDNWALTRAVRVEFGGRYANYGYLEDQGLFSPRAGVTVKPSERDSLTLRASVSHRESAPGAEEFIPPALGVWLPPERTFSAVSRGTFRPERIDHVEVGAERQMPGAVLVGVRAFRQRGEDQIVTLFGVGTADEIGGHRPLPRRFGGRLRGGGLGREREPQRRPVDPRVGGLFPGGRASGPGTRATSWRWRTWPATFCGAPIACTTSRRRVESVVPVSSTRVFVLYKLNSRPSPPTASNRCRRAARASTSRSTRRCRSGSRGRGGKRWWR